MYYKIISGGKIVDACDGLKFVRWQEKNQRFLACEEQNANGLVTSDGKTFLLEGTAPIKDYAYAAYSPISDEEATALLAALTSGAPVEDTDETIFDNDSLDVIREGVIRKMSSSCAATIIAGIDVTLKDGQTCHFSLTLEDQLNLISLQSLLLTGAEFVPYHADGEECRYYSITDFTRIATAATNWKIYQESYFNSLRAYINSLLTLDELAAVTYGMTIPEEFQTDVLKRLLTARGM